MKAALLVALAVGVPLALMLLLSSGRSAPVPAPMSSPTPPTATVRSGEIAPLPAVGAPALPAATAFTDEPFNLAERIEQWLQPWQQRLETKPDSPRAAAADDLRAGRFEQAAAGFDRLLTQSPDDADLLRGAAAAFCKLGRYDDALPLLARAIEIEPADSSARYQYAVALTRLDRRAEAVAALEGLLSIRSDHARARFALAVLQQSLGWRTEALATWRLLTEGLPAALPADARSPTALDPAAFCEALFHRGEVAMALQQNQEAAECFRQVVQRRADDALAWCNLGITHAALGQEEEAIAALTEALKHRADLVPAINQLAYVYAARYRLFSDPGDRDRIVDLCLRSLAIRSYQPNIRALKSAAIEAEWARSAPAEDEPSQPPRQER